MVAACRHCNRHWPNSNTLCQFSQSGIPAVHARSISMSNLTSTPSGPSPALRSNHRNGARNGANHTFGTRTPPGERTFGTALWESKLEKINLNRKLLEDIKAELLEETLDSLRKIAETLEDDQWKYQDFSASGIQIKLPF